MTSSLDFKRIFESTPTPYMVLSPDYHIIGASDAYLKATLTAREKVIGKHLFEVFPDNPDDPTADGTANLRASLDRVRQFKKPDMMPEQKYDIRRSDADGGGFEIRYWLPINTPVFDEEGELHCILHRADDVTETVRLRKVGETNARLSEEYNHFFSTALDMLCISSYDGFFRKVNPSFETVLGFTTAELQNSSYLSFIHPDDIEKTKLEVEKQMKELRPVFNFENRYRHKNGSYRLLSWKSAPTETFMYAAARDITEMRQTQEDLRVAKESADLANRELEAFSYSVAHDLRAPLRSMVGFSNILLEDFSANLPAEAKSTLMRVIDAAKKMGQLVDGLLDLSQITRKKINQQPLALQEIAEEVSNELKAANPQRNATFVIKEVPPSEGDAVLMKVVLTNLMNNAFKYSRNSSDGGRIEFGSSGERNGKPVYYVRDNGAGFDMAYANKLFGVFQRLHSVQEFEGTGIGLATTQRIIRRHFGEIWAEAAPGKGATFYFTL